MCRNIKTLYNFEPPASASEIHASALQFVRKVSGFHTPSKANQAVFDTAVREVEAAVKALFDGLVTTATPRNREVEAARARARAAKRYGTSAREPGRG